MWLSCHMKKGVVPLTTVVPSAPPLRGAFACEVTSKAYVAVPVILYNSSPLLDCQGLELLAVVERMSVGSAKLAFLFALIVETVLVREFIDFLDFLRLVGVSCLLKGFFLVGSLLFLAETFLPIPS